MLFIAWDYIPDTVEQEERIASESKMHCIVLLSLTCMIRARRL